MPPDDSTSTIAALARWGRLGIKRLRPADLFDAWLFAETEASLALAAWMSAPVGEKRDAYTSYLAALDREAQAAGMLELRLADAAG
jgi:hypothetical protein